MGENNVEIGKYENVEIGSCTIVNFLTTIWKLLKSYPGRVKYK